MTTSQDKITQLRTGLLRLGKRIAELEALDVKTISDYKQQIKPIEQSIEDTLREAFGAGSAQYALYSDAIKLFNNAHFYTRGYLRETVQKRVPLSLAQLRKAESQLAEQLEAIEINVARPPATVVAPKRSVFIVHGHDDQSRTEVVRFLDRIGFEAIILHEQPNQGRTIIEKIEDYSDVNFAIMLFTPDDVGGKPDEAPKPRARQNVILELGYFLGRLGRNRVCALKKGDIELPSDIFGIAWESLDAGKGWQQTLARELEAAGYAIDWRKIALSG